MIERTAKWLRLAQAQALDARAATELSRLGLPFLPWTSSSLRPAAMWQLLNEVIINQRLRVVELGAGVSTLAFAKVLGPLGGRLISIEDDAGWAQMVRGLLAQHGLGEAVTIVEAPLAPCAAAADGLAWFSSDAVASALSGFEIDLLLVDGPKAIAPGHALARLPAWPMLCTHMAARSAIALDDAARDGEREVMRRWQADPAFDFSVAMQASGIALATRGAAFNTAP
ncbi:MAG: class I SAM-dependent methyltransferase [Polymorphobacter sp.]|uniref:class I SAM-dependent methyltransferase n=1 Tax=Polymorphobacter sp. TaxID=1909290 RepID=UPI003A85DD18